MAYVTLDSAAQALQGQEDQLVGLLGLVRNLGDRLGRLRIGIAQGDQRGDGRAGDVQVGDLGDKLLCRVRI